MVLIKCPIQECSYQTPDESCELVCRLLDLHKIEHEKNSGSSKSVSMPNEPQLIRPRVDHGISFHSQVGGIQNWFEHKQPECKHTLVSMCSNLVISSWQMILG